MVPNRQPSMIPSADVTQKEDLVSVLPSSIVTHSVVVNIADTTRIIPNKLFADDGTLTGTLDDLRTALSLLRCQDPDAGLFLKLLKTRIFWPFNTSPVRSDFRRCDLPLEAWMDQGLRLLRALPVKHHFTIPFKPNYSFVATPSTSCTASATIVHASACITLSPLLALRRTLSRALLLKSTTYKGPSTNP